MQIGFIGLGTMGKPIACNLARKSGHPVTVYDISTASFDELRAQGASTTDDLAAVAGGQGGRNVLFLCLPSSEAVEGVFYSGGGLLERLRPGHQVVDLSTITHSTTLRLARDCAARGVGFLDAPVSGMKARAIDGTLTVMCGGEEALFIEIEPLLRHIGNNILYMGQSGSGQLAKLINQLLFDINAAALAEVLPMAAKMGLDAEKIGAIVNSGTGRSYASEFFIPRILKGVFHDGYPMAHAYKDLVSAAELGARQEIPLPVLAASTATYQTALRKGYGKLDKGGMIRVYEELLGVEFRGGKESGA